MRSQLELFRDKYALVTGGSSGLGRAFAYRLASAGINLYLISRNESELEQLCVEIQQSFGVEAIGIPLDLRDRVSLASQVKEFERKGVEFNIVINNAGVGHIEQFARSAPDRLSDIVDVNVQAFSMILRFAVSNMLRHGTRSFVINVGSLAGYQGAPDMACYTASKAFVRILSETVSYELAGNELITVTHFSPGGVQTSFSEKAGRPLKMSESKDLPKPSVVIEAALAGALRGRDRVLVDKLAWIKSMVLSTFPRKMIFNILTKRDE